MLEFGLSRFQGKVPVSKANCWWFVEITKPQGDCKPDAAAIKKNE